LLNSTLSTSVNLSASSASGTTPVFSFNLSSILINAAFGTAAGGYSQLIGAATGSGAFGDAAASPINLTGAVVDEATKPKEK
jgi:hypothetical protein